jgi:hypothetical protein
LSGAKADTWLVCHCHQLAIWSHPRTAQLLSDVEPRTDERASIPKGAQEFGRRIAELRKTHPHGVAGALASIPELREPLYKQGEALLELVKDVLAELSEGQRGLIVSHDGTMVAMEKVLT